MEEGTTVGQRFLAFISHLGISKNAFAASLDKTATVIQHLVDERNKPGFDLLCKVFEVYPNVSKNWLLQGVGPMLSEEQPAVTTSATPGVADAISANASKPTASQKPEPPIPAAASAASVDIMPPAAEPVPVTASPVTPEPTAAQPLQAPAAVPAAPAIVAPVGAAPADTSWQTALYTQQMAHQLALAELRNQHLQDQQRLMQQMMDLMQRQLTR